MSQRGAVPTHSNMYCWISVNGQRCPVTNLLDIDGVELGPEDQLHQVDKVVALLPNGRWIELHADYRDLRPLS